MDLFSNGLRVFQYSDKLMQGIVLYYIHLTIDKQYNSIENEAIIIIIIIIIEF